MLLSSYPETTRMNLPTGPGGTRTAVPGQYFADTAVTDAQPPGDVRGTLAAFGQLHDALPHHMR